MTSGSPSEPSWRGVQAPGGHQHKSGAPTAVIAGPLIFLSALRGIDPATGTVPADPVAQADQLFVNLDKALDAAGAGKADVVKVAVYMRRLHEHRKLFDTAWQAYFGSRQPVRFAVEVNDFGAEGDDSYFLADVTGYRTDPSSTTPAEASS